MITYQLSLFDSEVILLFVFVFLFSIGSISFIRCDKRNYKIDTKILNQLTLPSLSAEDTACSLLALNLILPEGWTVPCMTFF